MCGQCHYGSIPGLPVLTNSQLTAAAKDMHLAGVRPTANFTYMADATVSYMVNFTASGCPAGDTCTYDWDFGDGSTHGTGVTTSRTYADATARTVTLVMTDTTAGVSSDPASKTVTPVSRNTAPTASMTYVTSGMTVTVTDTSTDDGGQSALAVTVNCGNGTIVTGSGGSVLVCTYTTTGTYTIRHSVMDTGGLGSSSAPVSVTVSSAKYSVSGKVTQSNGTTAIPYASLTLKLAGVTKYAATSNSTGAFTFGSVLPGTYTLTATKAGVTFPAPDTVTVTSANVTGLVVSSTTP